MSENLFFILLIAKALQEPDIEKALRKAFHEIKRKGTQKRYAEGFKNFELFMDAAYCRHDITTDHINELIAQLATGMFEGTAQEMKSLLDIIGSHPEWKAEYEAIRRGEANEDLTHSFPTIGVLSNKGLVIERTFKKVPGCESFDGILPGNYKIELINTGWIIWEGKLTAEELIWAKAHKDKNLLMAAETKDIQMLPTGEKVLLDGDLILRTYAGTESGRIEIELTK